MSFSCLGRTLLTTATLTFLAACSPTEQDFTPESHGQTAFTKEHFHTVDAIDLTYRKWLPKGEPDAVIIALHGMNDYSHSFEGTGKFFSKHGVAVYAYDQRGFGGSPNAGVWGGEKNFTRDLRNYVVAIKQRHPDTPVYVLGESMGGAIAITALSEPDFPKVDGIILSAPAVWGAETIPALYRGTLWLAAHTIPYKRFSGNALKIIASNNYPMLRALSSDPLVIKGTRVDAVYGVVHLMDSAYEKIPQLHTPTLLLYGAHDQVIPKEPVKSALTRFSQPIEYVYYPNGYHMLLRDLQAEVVMEDILSWIDDPKEQVPSGFGKVRGPLDVPADDEIMAGKES